MKGKAPASDGFEWSPPLDAGEQLLLDLDGYEGPIDVLLSLARAQKVDLAKISLVKLVDQYLAFVQRAKVLRLELAADYLVMAAWLAFLKSRLMLPVPLEEEEAAFSPQDLVFQLQRLEAMKKAATQLFARSRLGVDVFARPVAPPAQATPDPEVPTASVYEVGLYDLLSAYARQHRPAHAQSLRIAPTDLDSVELALERLSAWVGRLPDWRDLASFLPLGLTDGLLMRSAIAATFAASLELVKSGRAELAQSEPFGPLLLRSR
jgi:segregation and condensation protein A